MIHTNSSIDYVARIAVLITCHNRRNKTVACLAALSASVDLNRIWLTILLADDGCTDGTQAAVKLQYPQVEILAGNGSLYWNGGMRLAFSEAMKGKFDYFLWLNDDTLLYPHALSGLVALARAELLRLGRPAVIVGTTQDSTDGAATYGGLRQKSIWQPLNHKLVLAGTVPVPCETMNGNCVLIPDAVARTVGNLEPAFVHAMGDIDYGLRVRKAGFPLAVLPGYVGVCSHNPVDNTFLDRRLSLRNRWAKILSPKGLPPRQWYVLVRRHAGLLWPMLLVWPYLKVMLSRRLKSK